MRSSPSIRKNPVVIGAAVTALATAISAFTAFAGQAIQVFSPQLKEEQRSCIEILEGYRSFIANDPRQVGLLLEPGDDGVPILAADPDASRCGIDASVVRRFIAK